MQLHEVTLKPRDDENELIKNAQNGCQEAMGLLCEAYRPAILAAALKTSARHANVPFPDAKQQAYLYFVECIHAFSPEKAETHGGLKYWVSKCVTVRMFDYWKKQNVIRVPANLKWDQFGPQICAAISAKNLSDIQHENSNHCESGESELNFLVDGSSEDPADAFEKKGQQQAIKSALKKISKPLRDMLIDRYHGTGPKELGEKYGMSKQKAHQWVQRAERQLSEHVQLLMSVSRKREAMCV